MESGLSFGSRSASPEKASHLAMKHFLRCDEERFRNLIAQALAPFPLMGRLPRSCRA